MGCSDTTNTNSKSYSVSRTNESIIIKGDIDIDDILVIENGKEHRVLTGGPTEYSHLIVKKLILKYKIEKDFLKLSFNTSEEINKDITMTFTQSHDIKNALIENIMNEKIIETNNEMIVPLFIIKKDEEEIKVSSKIKYKKL